MYILLVWAFGDQGAALDLRRVFDPFETRFAIELTCYFEFARVALRADLTLSYRALMARATQ